MTSIFYLPHRSWAAVRQTAAALAWVLVATLTAGGVYANSDVPLPLPTASSAAPAKARLSATTRGIAVSRPSWATLTALQQQALAPLAPMWDTRISAGQKKKWLAVSKNYTALQPEAQHTLHSRMKEWAALTPHQRAQARFNFAKTQELAEQLTPEEKKTKWEAYQALSAEEKRALAAKAPKKPRGAAAVIQPVAPQKLATPRPQQSSLTPAPKIAPAPASAASPANH